MSEPWMKCKKIYVSLSAEKINSNFSETCCYDSLKYPHE